MTIAGIESTIPANAKGETTKPGELGRDDFLNLLVTQLQHQDPLNPMDSTDFTAQLAQFSSLEQLSNMSGQLEDMAHSQAVFASSQAVGYIGHTVLSAGSDFTHDGEADASLAFELEAPAHNVYLSIYDATGGFVTSFESGGKAAGRQTAFWDGEDSDGNLMPAGNYRFEAMAISAGGEEIRIRPLSSGRVDGVAFVDGQAMLKLGQREVALKDVIEVIRPISPISED
jgi:flagellar basal-body rod modification protein FlgD